MGRKKKVQEDKETSIISKELLRYEKQIAEIQEALEDMNLKLITDMDEKAKVMKTKVEVMGKLPSLLSALEELRTKNKIKNEEIKGSADLSPLEDGTLGSEDDDAAY